MFDDHTTKLIQNSFPLKGLDLKRLPQDLTDAYASIVSARLGALKFENQDDEIQEHIIKLRKLSDTYEALTLFLPLDDPTRVSCAFVAGSAQHALNQARRIRLMHSNASDHHSSLTASSVGSEVAAALLFLLGGHHADACEAAKSFELKNESEEAAQLLQFISALAIGNGQDLVAVIEEPLRKPALKNRDFIEQAANIIWTEIASAVQDLCRMVFRR